MQIKALLTSLAVATGAVAQVTVVPVSNSTVITTVVSSFTTICPLPTVITYSSVCYTASTAGQTLTITNCPCTITTTAGYGYAAATKTSGPTYVTAGADKQKAALGLGAMAAGAAAMLL